MESTMPSAYSDPLKLALRRAFYSGAGLVLSNVLEFANPALMTEEEAVQHLHDMEAEMAEFVQSLTDQLKRELRKRSSNN